ncbi:VWA domain-containing protein [Notoacmeibacter sp. MSK16QG-6]|uniref:vWA domain-containing protein n=1 Tax=Notoacmeibacter sp. MSK16QG-6 TaxID=2957982 RepID=UPI0020A02395|nr:VWA domain-containing protein [Notoacmeibacter sp. MSK16QG-6]MCP1199438.1 VWA domain-containing protein [Notoacmeibacter sp. MSK16QG-6]
MNTFGPSLERALDGSPDKSRLADNIVHFGRTLRKAGMKVGPATVVTAIEAVMAAGIGSRDDFYWTLHSVFVKRREDRATFDEAFRLYWRSRELMEKMIAMFSPTMEREQERQKPKPAEQRVNDALFEKHHHARPVREKPEIEVDARHTVSGNEILRQKDFAQMTAAELAEARDLIADLQLSMDELPARRFRPDMRGRRFDGRATLRHAMRSGGDIILPRYKKRRRVHPPLVALCDISGSMSQYSRVVLYFLHALAHRRKVHSFVFGTRLTNLSRQLRHKDPDEALADVAASVQDWSGGTRIGETLHNFNRDWSRRVLGQGASVLLITDGLEREGSELLAREMERLQKSCKRLIWLNPLLRFDGFEARAAGVRAMLPFVDEFRPVHNMDSLAGLCAALSTGMKADDTDPRRWIDNGRPVVANRYSFVGREIEDGSGHERPVA